MFSYNYYYSNIFFGCILIKTFGLYEKVRKEPFIIWRIWLHYPSGILIAIQSIYLFIDAVSFK